MFSVKSVKLENFGSHKNTELKFRSGISIISGINETDQGQRSNGSGKSFLIEAVIFALTGIPFRKAKSEELIFNGESNCTVEMTYGNSLKEFKVVRSLFLKKASTVELYENGEEKKLSSVNEYNKYVLDSIGLSREDIVDYFLISKEKYTSFFSSSDTAKKELINRFSKANLIDPVNDDLKSNISEVEGEINKVKRDIEKAEVSIETYKESVKDASLDEIIKRDQGMIHGLETDIRDCEKEIFTKKSILKDKEKQAEEVIVPDVVKEVNEVEKEIKVKGEELKDLEEVQKELRSLFIEQRELVNELNNKLSGTINCPSCDYEFSLADKNFDPEKAKQQLKEAKGVLSEIENEGKIAATEVDKCKDVLRELKQKGAEIESEKRSALLKRRGLQEEIASIQRSIKNKTSEIESMHKEIEVFKNKEYQDPSESIKKKVEAVEERLNVLRDEEQQITELKNSLETWAILFKRFKGYLANSSLGSIEGHTNMYLEKLKSNIRIKIDGFKELSNGKVKEQIDVTVLKDGIEVGSFGKLSSGEKARVEVSTIFAINNLVNLSSEGKGLNFVILDEILESLDSEGIDSIIGALFELGQNVMLITHGQVNTNEADNIVVVKEKGVSKLK